MPQHTRFSTGQNHASENGSLGRMSKAVALALGVKGAGGEVLALGSPTERRPFERRFQLRRDVFFDHFASVRVATLQSQQFGVGQERQVESRSGDALQPVNSILQVHGFVIPSGADRRRRLCARRRNRNVKAAPVRLR
jgi:hypothetical protein